MKNTCNIERLKGMDLEFLEQIRPMFMKNAPLYISSIERAVEENNFAQVVFYSHKLYGASVTIGASILAETSTEIENIALNSELDRETLREMVKSLSGMVEEYDKCLEEYLLTMTKI